jgi:methionyl-tRNA formyltransferase
VPLRLIMMGTGTFALPTFQALIESAHEVVALVTQPDRVGRGHHHHPHPMKDAALEAGIPVLQPEKVNRPEVLEQLTSFGPDLFVVAAYGQILSPDLLEIPRLGAVNVHGSLLPKYRGAAPIQYAIWHGETETGLTLFQLEPKLDAGPILGMVKTPIGPKETAGELHDRLAAIAPPLTLEVLRGLETGEIQRRPQTPAG